MAFAFASNCAWNLSKLAEVLVDRGAELAVRLVAAVGGQVRPEHRVVDVPAEVEGEVLLQPVDRLPNESAVAGLGELVERGVDALDVGRMVLEWCSSMISPEMCGASAP